MFSCANNLFLLLSSLSLFDTARLECCGRRGSMGTKEKCLSLHEMDSSSIKRAPHLISV